MPKLSRKEKYKDLRDSLDQESEPKSTTKQVRTNRMAAPDFKADQKTRGPVIDDLLGEVKQYNLDNGDLVIEDTQMQILHDLSSQEQAAARRSVHFETMEQNEEAGGTTRNLYGTDLSSLMASQPRHVPTPKAKQVSPSITKAASQKPTSEEPDFLDLFTPGKASQEEPIVEVVEEDYQEKTKERKSFFSTSKDSTKRKRKKSKSQESYEEALPENETYFDEREDNNLDSLFTTTEVSIDAPYFMPQNQISSITPSSQSTISNEANYSNEVEEEFDYEEEQPTHNFSSLFNKVRQKIKKLDEDDDYEEEEEPYIEKSVPAPRKAKESSQPKTKENAKQSEVTRTNTTKRKASTQSKEKNQRTSQKAQKIKEEASTQDSNDESSVSTPAIIFMVVCCIILVILILLTIFWMSKLGIF